MEAGTYYVSVRNPILKEKYIPDHLNHDPS
jgi:hypothetical protein